MWTKTDRFLILLPWGSVVILAVRFLMLWNQLPASLAVHFDITGEPNTRLGRGVFLAIVMLSISTQILVHSWLLRKIPDKVIHWFLRGSLYFTTAVMASIFWEVLQYNVFGTSIRWLWVGVITVVATGFVLVIVGIKGLRTQGSVMPKTDSRPDTLPGKVLAEAVHRSKPFFWGSLPFVFIPVVIWLLCPLVFCKVLAVITEMILVLVPVTGLVGMRYRFTDNGVEIRGWWSRTKFIPATEIDDYDVRTIHPLRDFGGWGVRTGLRSEFSNAKAFILGGRRAVRIKTGKEQIYLGHHEPEKIIRNLDAMMKRAK